MSVRLEQGVDRLSVEDHWVGCGRGQRLASSFSNTIPNLLETRARAILHFTFLIWFWFWFWLVDFALGFPCKAIQRHGYI